MEGDSLGAYGPLADGKGQRALPFSPAVPGPLGRPSLLLGVASKLLILTVSFSFDAAQLPCSGREQAFSGKEHDVLSNVF